MNHWSAGLGRGALETGGDGKVEARPLAMCLQEGGGGGGREEKEGGKRDGDGDRYGD